MRNSESLRSLPGPELGKLNLGQISVPRHFLLGIILILALLAFEAFNFDTTRYALQNLLGEVRFAGIAWATILAIAFCAIDFAGLGRLFTPERGRDEPKEIWYLTGAWLLGATMNAVMTWWAVSTVLLTHDLGNEVLSREQLLHIVPVFVAVLVWLTRILFIGAVTLAGERLLHGKSGHSQSKAVHRPVSSGPTAKTRPAYAADSGQARTKRGMRPVELGSKASPAGNGTASRTRVRQRPPRPGGPKKGPVGYGGVQAKSRGNS